MKKNCKQELHYFEEADFSESKMLVESIDDSIESSISNDIQSLVLNKDKHIEIKYSRKIKEILKCFNFR